MLSFRVAPSQDREINLMRWFHDCNGIHLILLVLFAITLGRNFHYTNALLPGSFLA